MSCRRLHEKILQDSYWKIRFQACFRILPESLKIRQERTVDDFVNNLWVIELNLSLMVYTGPFQAVPWSLRGFFGVEKVQKVHPESFCAGTKTVAKTQE